MYHFFLIYIYLFDHLYHVYIYNRINHFLNRVSLMGRPHAQVPAEFIVL